MPEWLSTALSSGSVAAIVILIFQKYIIRRIDHDFDEKLEKLKPLTAEETLKRQNYFNSKREAFFDAVSIISRHLESVPWSGPDVPVDRPLYGIRPSEAEVNTCFAKLSLFSDDPHIPEQFFACFNNASPVLLGHFVNLLRKDLGYGKLESSPDNYMYFFKRGSEEE